MAVMQTHEGLNGDADDHPQTQIQSSPRKRRRRAPTTGAADDCFACQERLVKCDRRRPYCTPCLDLGKDCSGYKTALTWGVGVASRGKLRGLSLPIACSKKAAPSHDDTEDALESPPRKLTKLQPTRKDSVSSKEEKVQRSIRSASSTTATTPTTYGFVNIDPGAPATSASTPSYASHNFEWRRPHSMSHTRDIRAGDKKPRRHTLQPISVSAMHPARDYGVMPMTASVVGGYGHHNFGLSSQISPMVPSFSGYEISHSPKEYVDPMNGSYETHFATNHSPWTSHEIASGVLSEGTHRTNNVVGGHYMAHDERVMPLHQHIMSPPGIISGANQASLPHQPNIGDYAGDISALVPDDVGDHTSYNLPTPLSPYGMVNTPGLQYLIDHYNNVVSPTIFALDGSADYLRNHVSSLAIDSHNLQHAIATLAACDLRIRRARQSEYDTRGGFRRDSVQSDGHRSRRPSTVAERLSEISSGDPLSEEFLHKTKAMSILHDQLTHSGPERDDSILATLLILSIYHVCDMGVVKFKTNVSEIRNIVAQGLKGDEGSATSWLTIMLTWLDDMASSAHHGGHQPHSEERDISSLKGSDLATESLAGCDSRLFNLITRVCRLDALNATQPLSNPSPRHAVHPLNATTQKDYYSMSPSDFTPPPVGTNTAVWSDVRSLPQQQQPPTPSPSPPRTHQFLTEWHELHHALSSWVPPPASSSRNGSYHDYDDTFHISNAFRYTALIYLSRLLHTSLPNNNSTFQDSVSKAIYHISRIQSDVFLLWPLFITGTDTISQEGRGMIRQRCMDLKRQSGIFNTINTLDILASIWNEEPIPDVKQGRRRSSLKEGDGQSLAAGMGAEEFNGQGFRWRKAMERVDGEYIVV